MKQLFNVFGKEFDLYNNVVSKTLRSYINFVPLDRFGLYKDISGYDVYYDKCPQLTTLSFEESCARRVEEIENKGKDIIIFSSGGIDSLAAIAAFGLFGKHKERVSVIQFPNHEIYEPLIKFSNKQGISYKVYDMGTHLDLDNKILVDGECGDCLSKASFSPFFHVLRAKDFSFTDFWNVFLSEEGVEWRKKALVPIESAGDVFWYSTFAFRARKIETLHLLHLVYGMTGQVIDINNKMSFFTGDVFDNYGFSNYEKFKGEEQYKPQHNKLIKDFFCTKMCKILVDSIGKVNSIRITLNAPDIPGRHQLNEGPGYFFNNRTWIDNGHLTFEECDGGKAL